MVSRSASQQCACKSIAANAAGRYTCHKNTHTQGSLEVPTHTHMLERAPTSNNTTMWKNTGVWFLRCSRIRKASPTKMPFKGPPAIPFSFIGHALLQSPPAIAFALRSQSPSMCP
eukprot:4438030-Amphidinium_carterae.1